ncbi:glucoamylase family protein [Singulisphaera rosea]
MGLRKLVGAIAFGILVGTNASASPIDLKPEDRELLASYARDTWRSIEAVAAAGSLPADQLRKTKAGWVAEGLTSPTNVAGYLWSTLAAERLNLISHEESGRRISGVLGTLVRLERSHGFFYNWYEPASGARALAWPSGGAIRPFLSSVDNGWLAVALMLVGNVRPDLKPQADAILEPMDFAFFYDPYDPANPVAHPGLLYGGYWTDDKHFTGFHYGTLNAETRIASYVGIARGQLPADHYFRMARAFPEGSTSTAISVHPAVYQGVEVAERSRTYRGIRLVPSWEGTMFEALMVPLFVPESEWAPTSWGLNHTLYASAQMEYGLTDARLGYWGISASADPAGGYRAYGVAEIGSRVRPSARGRETVVTPHATFLALAFLPREAMANLRALSTHFPVYGSYGFYDAVDVVSGQVSDSLLVLDQAMIMASISNALDGDFLHRAFSVGKVETVIRPLIAPERFAVDGNLDPQIGHIADVHRASADGAPPTSVVLRDSAQRAQAHRPSEGVVSDDNPADRFVTALFDLSWADGLSTILVEGFSPFLTSGDAWRGNSRDVPWLLTEITGSK